MATLTYDTKSSTSLTTDSRSSAGTLTQDSRTFEYLWVATTFPWNQIAPWQISGDGQILLKDIRN